MNAVPVDLGEVYQGFANGLGLIRDEGDHLCLEFQIQDALFGVIKTNIKEVRIPLSEVALVFLERSWFGLVNRLVVQLTRMDLLKDLPGISQGRLILRVARKDRAAAMAFVAALQDREERPPMAATPMPEPSPEPDDRIRPAPWPR